MPTVASSLVWVGRHPIPSRCCGTIRARPILGVLRWMETTVPRDEENESTSTLGRDDMVEFLRKRSTTNRVNDTVRGCHRLELTAYTLSCSGLPARTGQAHESGRQRAASDPAARTRSSFQIERYRCARPKAAGFPKVWKDLDLTKGMAQEPRATSESWQVNRGNAAHVQFLFTSAWSRSPFKQERCWTSS